MRRFSFIALKPFLFIKKIYFRAGKVIISSLPPPVAEKPCGRMRKRVWHDNLFHNMPTTMAAGWARGKSRLCEFEKIVRASPSWGMWGYKYTPSRGRKISQRSTLLLHSLSCIPLSAPRKSYSRCFYNVW